MEYLVTGEPEDDYTHPSPAIQHIIGICERDPEMLSMFLQMAERAGYGTPTSPDNARDRETGV